MQQKNSFRQTITKALTKPWTLKSAPDHIDLINPGAYSRSDIVEQNGNWFWSAGGGGVERFFSYSSHKSAIIAYQRCAPVTAIINRKSQAFSNGKMWILDKDGKEVDTDAAKRLRKLMKRPNPLQTWKQFDAQGYIYQQLFGYCPVLAIKPAGFKENIYTKSLWNIPPFMVKIKESGAIFYQQDMAGMIEKITLTYKQKEVDLDPNDVLILRDFSPSFSTLLLPESRIKSVEMPVNNIIGAMESRNVLINYRGALGILTPEKDQFGVVAVDNDDKEDLQRDFLRYGLTSQQWKFIISSAALKWQQMGIPTKDLMLIEEVVESTKMICDVFHHPAQMLGIIDPKHDNWNAAEQDLYQNGIIPESDSNMEQWNQFFKTEELSLVISKTFDHIPILQKDQVQMATARKTLNEALEVEWKNGLITLDQWLDKLGEEPLPGGAGQVRFNDVNSKNVPLAVTLGVGGVQALIAVVTDGAMSSEAKKATLVALFGIDEATAASMVVEEESEDEGGDGGGSGQVPPAGPQHPEE